MAFLTDRTLATGVSLTDLVHVVITGDTSQNPAGSSYKAQLSQITSLITPLSITGGTYNPTTGVVTFTNSSGGTFDVSGFTTGYTAVEVTGFTYNDSNTFSILETDATILTASINVVTGMTFNGFLRTSGSTSSGIYSFSIGKTTSAIGDYSLASGNSSIANGDDSHAEGGNCTTNGKSSHAEGNNTLADGQGSHSEGEGTITYGDTSHAEGHYTTTYGAGSHTEGSGTTTYGQYSHAEGLGTITNGEYQHAQGQYNLTASTQSAFIIGNGINDSNRSNLVFAAGNEFNIYGDLNVTGTVYSTGSTQFISTTGITTSAITLSSGITYNGINYLGNVDVTIPDPTNLTGLKVIIKDEGGNAGSYRIRVTPSVGTIDGNSYIDMNINYMSLTFVARNNNWWII